MGGLAAAVRSIDGESPEMVVTNTRDPGQPEMTGMDKFLGAEFRTRYVNPTWIEGMQREGYAEHGVGCSEHTCGNPRLLRYVLEQGAVMNIGTTRCWPPSAPSPGRRRR